jgi:YtkA-like
MRYLLALSVLAVALAAPAAAPAGGWATVELAAIPAGIDAGDTWTARFTVLRHGVTPTDGAEPSVTVVHPLSSETSTFPADPAGEPGVYEAAVVFPEAGTWTFEIDNGLAATGYGESQTTTFDPVAVGAPGGGGVIDGGGLLSRLPLGVVGLLLALGVITIFGIRRLRGLAPAGR